MNMMYWAPTPEERRKKLMPFFWNVLVLRDRFMETGILEIK